MHHRSRRRILATASALAVAGSLALTACSSEEEAPLSFADKRVGAMDNYERGVQFRATTEEPLTFSVMINNHPAYPLDLDWEFWGWLEDLTNVNFEFVEAPLSDFNARRTTLINAGEAPQIITRFYQPQENEFIASGALLPVSDYVDLLPNYKWRVENWNLQPDLLTRTQEDGKYYVLSGLHEVVTPDYTFAARTDLLEKHNIDPPTTIEEFRDMLEVLKDEECAGVEGCYPLSDRFNFAPPDRPGGNLIRTIGRAHGVVAGWDYDAHNWNYETQQFEVTATSDGYRETLEYLNGLVEDGLLDPESFTQQDDQARQKLAQGKSFVISSNSQNIVNDYRNDLAGIPGATIAKLPIPTGPAGNVINGLRLENGIAFNADVVDSENFVALMQFSDWLWFSEAGQELAKWGKEGETYAKASDGTRTLNDDITMLGFNPTATLHLQKDFGVYNGAFVYGGTKDLVRSFFSEEELEFQASLEDRELLPVAPPAPFNEEENEEATLIRTNLNTHVMAETLKFILGQRPFSEWDAFVDEVNGLGGEDYLALVNAAKDRFAASTS